MTATVEALGVESFDPLGVETLDTLGVETALAVETLDALAEESSGLLGEETFEPRREVEAAERSGEDFDDLGVDTVSIS